MPQFCTECGAAMEPGKKFCTGCGAKAESAAQTPAAPVQAQPAVQAEPYAGQNQYAAQQTGEPAAQMTMPRHYPDQGVYPPSPAFTLEAKPITMLGYLGYLFVMSIPVMGLVMSIVLGFKSPKANTRNLARAMIFFNVVWLIVFVAFALTAYSAMSQLSEIVDFNFKIFGLELNVW